jgi:hypothetical protein
MRHALPDADSVWWPVARDYLADDPFARGVFPRADRRRSHRLALGRLLLPADYGHAVPFLAVIARTSRKYAEADWVERPVREYLPDMPPEQ